MAIYQFEVGILLIPTPILIELVQTNKSRSLGAHVLNSQESTTKFGEKIESVLACSSHSVDEHPETSTRLGSCTRNEVLQLSECLVMRPRVKVFTEADTPALKDAGHANWYSTCKATSTM